MKSDKAAWILFFIIIWIIGYTITVYADDVAWNPSEKADGYIIYYYRQLDVGDVTRIDIADLGLLADTEYQLCVIAYNHNKQLRSGPSNVITHKTPEETEADPVPLVFDKPATVIIQIN